MNETPSQKKKIFNDTDRRDVGVYKIDAMIIDR